MDNIKKIKKILTEHIISAEAVLDNHSIICEINKISSLITDTIKSGGQLLICGNGGSAADSQHLATELVSRFYKERHAYNAEALTVNTSSITAIGNDYSFDNVFARQVEAKGHRGDVLLGISTSGNSKNVIKALETAKGIDMKTIGFTGNNVCKMDEICDCIIHVPSDDTPRIQEMHILVGHILCEIIEEELSSL